MVPKPSKPFFREGLASHLLKMIEKLLRLRSTYVRFALPYVRGSEIYERTYSLNLLRIYSHTPMRTTPLVYLLRTYNSMSVSID